MPELKNTDSLLRDLRGGLIVSCQPAADDAAADPMNRPEIMAALAQSVVFGGAAGIRADTPAHIAAISSVISAPVIGIFKQDIPGFAVRITPTVEAAVAVARAGAAFVAVDGTDRPRPDGLGAEDFIRAAIRTAACPVMADIATFDEGLAAAGAGACAVLTTLSGYTAGAPVPEEPDFALLSRLVKALSIPVIAEGRYNTPEQAARALELGAWAVTVGSAITRPRFITSRFIRALRARA